MRNAPGECPQNESQFGPRREDSILHAVVPVVHMLRTRRFLAPPCGESIPSYGHGESPLVVWK